jgi:hypothetical protein
MEINCNKCGDLGIERNDIWYNDENCVWCQRCKHITCIPMQPERSKREDSRKCEMRCSEHCSNAVRDK